MIVFTDKEPLIKGSKSAIAEIYQQQDTDEQPLQPPIKIVNVFRDGDTTGLDAIVMQWIAFFKRKTSAKPANAVQQAMYDDFMNDSICNRNVLLKIKQREFDSEQMEAQEWYGMLDGKEGAAKAKEKIAITNDLVKQLKRELEKSLETVQLEVDNETSIELELVEKQQQQIEALQKENEKMKKKNAKMKLQLAKSKKRPRSPEHEKSNKKPKCN